MEVREFFKGSPMHEITVSGSLGEWAVIAAILDGVLDCSALSEELSERLQNLGVTY